MAQLNDISQGLLSETLYALKNCFCTVKEEIIPTAENKRTQILRAISDVDSFELVRITTENTILESGGSYNRNYKVEYTIAGIPLCTDEFRERMTPNKFYFGADFGMNTQNLRRLHWWMTDNINKGASYELTRDNMLTPDANYKMANATTQQTDPNVDYDSLAKSKINEKINFYQRFVARKCAEAVLRAPCG